MIRVSEVPVDRRAALVGQLVLVATKENGWKYARVASIGKTGTPMVQMLREDHTTDTLAQAIEPADLTLTRGAAHALSS